MQAGKPGPERCLALSGDDQARGGARDSATLAGRIAISAVVNGATAHEAQGASIEATGRAVGWAFVWPALQIAQESGGGEPWAVEQNPAC
jgi:hypothetical protein